MDNLLYEFFDPKRWETAIATAVDKGISKSLLRDLSNPATRIDLYHKIRDGAYVVAPPHEAQIPKDDGSMRTVYVNEDIDRVVLAIYNDMLFELCPEMVHPRCKSYQKGIGCGTTVQEISRQLSRTKDADLGVKADLSKYFDSVPRGYINEIFDRIDNTLGRSAITDAVRLYYNTDTVYDMQKNLIQKYSSLRQGCAVAAFLADTVLADVDAACLAAGVNYVRYSDDILITGPKWRNGFQILSTMLDDKSLTLNPKKVEFIRRDKWFTFLGFSLKDNMISLSPNRIKTFQKEIEKRTVGQTSQSEKIIAAKVNSYLYRGNGEYSWAASVLPVINNEKDIQTINAFTMDAMRAACTGRKRIGGIGASKGLSDCIISRGNGRDVNTNRRLVPVLEGYATITCMRKAMLTSRGAYSALLSKLY